MSELKTLEDIVSEGKMGRDCVYLDDLQNLCREWIKRHDKIIKGFPKYGDSSSYIAINQFIKYVFNLKDDE